jgi:hypothetical protein
MGPPTAPQQWKGPEQNDPPLAAADSTGRGKTSQPAPPPPTASFIPALGEAWNAQMEGSTRTRSPQTRSRSPKSSRWQQRGVRLLATQARLLATGPKRTILAAKAAAAHTAAAHARGLRNQRLAAAAAAAHAAAAHARAGLGSNQRIIVAAGLLRVVLPPGHHPGRIKAHARGQMMTILPWIKTVR